MTTLTLHQELTHFHWGIKHNPLSYVRHDVFTSPRVNHKLQRALKDHLMYVYNSLSQEEDGVDNGEGGI